MELREGRGGLRGRRGWREKLEEIIMSQVADAKSKTVIACISIDGIEATVISQWIDHNLLSLICTDLVLAY